MTRAAVAVPNEYAADAAAELAEAGGSAVDAALAAILVALVSEPGTGSMGAGAFVAVAAPGEPAHTVDGTVAMPGIGLPRSAFGRGTVTVEMTYGGGTITEVGHGSVATPGALVAFETAHRLNGRAPWAAVVAPAARRAREGFTLSPSSGRYLMHALEPVYDRDPSSRTALRAADGTPLVPGDTVRLPELADFLDRVAVEGAAALHRGEVAAALATAMAEHGGLVTERDLAEYRAVVRPALAVRAGDWTLDTNPAPAVGGPVLGAMLALLETRWNGGHDTLAKLVEVQRQVLSHRVRELDLAPDRAAAVQAMLADVREDAARWQRSPSTVHVSAVDADGRACAITASAGYGSGVSVPGTGVWLNNCLGERELNRGGLHALPPGERLVSNMAPTVGRRDDGAVLAIGSPGADRIATAVLQVLLPMVHEGASPAEAVRRPRLHVTCADDGTPLRVEHEADLTGNGPPAGVADDLPWREHAPLSMFFGGVGIALRGPDGDVSAAADPRREGAVRVIG